MRALLTSIGSAGDIHPFIAIGRSLIERGHEVVFLANPHFKDRINHAGLGFWPLGTEAEYLSFIRHENLIAGARSSSHVLDELILPAFDPTIDALRELSTVFRPDVVLTHHISFGALAACELLNIRHAQAVLAPLFWLSRLEKVVLPSLPMPNAPAWADRLLRAILRPLGRLSLDRPINAKRRAVGLKPLTNIALTGARGGDGLKPSERLTHPAQGIRTLGLWSPLFRPSLADDPLTGVICGFSVWDRPAIAPDQDARQKALCAWMDDGPPPVVVTLGSSVSHHGHDVYRLAAEACTRLSRRVVLLTGVERPGARWPDNVRTVPYAPYSRVMSRACLTVHHGGIGTLAAALASGQPSIVIPFANDEYDNADRARRLGVGAVISRRKLSARTLAETIDRCAHNAPMRAKCQELATAMREENGAETAAKELEKLAAGPHLAQ